MINPAAAGFFVFGAVRFACRMAAAPYPAYGLARCRTGHVARFNTGRWFVGLISEAPSGNGMLHDSTLGARFVGPMSEAPSGNAMLHDSTLGAGFVGPISEAPSGNAAVAKLVNIKEGLRNKQGGRITRRYGPRPSGRCLRQRSLAMLESNLSRSFSSFPEWRI